MTPVISELLKHTSKKLSDSQESLLCVLVQTHFFFNDDIWCRQKDIATRYLHFIKQKPALQDLRFVKFSFRHRDYFVSRIIIISV